MCQPVLLHKPEDRWEQIHSRRPKLVATAKNAGCHYLRRGEQAVLATWKETRNTMRFGLRALCRRKYYRVGLFESDDLGRPPPRFATSSDLAQFYRWHVTWFVLGKGTASASSSLNSPASYLRIQSRSILRERLFRRASACRTAGRREILWQGRLNSN